MGKEIYEIEVPLKLLILIFLHAKWFIQMYNHMVDKDEKKLL